MLRYLDEDQKISLRADVHSLASAETGVRGDVTGDGLLTGADATVILRTYADTLKRIR